VDKLFSQLLARVTLPPHAESRERPQASVDGVFAMPPHHTLKDEDIVSRRVYGRRNVLGGIAKAMGVGAFLFSDAGPAHRGPSRENTEMRLLFAAFLAVALPAGTAVSGPLMSRSNCQSQRVIVPVDNWVNDYTPCANNCQSAYSSCQSSCSFAAYTGHYATGGEVESAYYACQSKCSADASSCRNNCELSARAKQR
jgi:hypothetical protein